MKLEEQIQYMFDKYPMLFQERKHCLDHLFCVIGNGYDWINGELISMHHVNRDEDFNIISIDEPIVELKGGSVAKQTIEYERHMFYNGHQWYEPTKNYSYLYVYPDNIKPDWLKGIEETRELLKKDGIEI